MSTFVLMELCKQSGVKNVVYQLLASSITPLGMMVLT